MKKKFTAEEGYSFMAHKYRIYPTPEQATLINKTFGCVRYVWNTLLAECIELGTTIVSGPAKLKDAEHLWLREIDSLALCNVQLALRQAFKNHFENPDHFGFPVFKSKRKSNRAYITNVSHDNIRFSDDRKYVRLPKLGWVELTYHRRLPKGAVIRSVTISQNPSGKYYISVLFAYENQVVEKTDVSHSVGLDFSMQQLYIPSEGTSPADSRFYRKFEEKLKKEQRHLSKLFVKGAERQSNRYYKQKRKVTKIHEKIANCRKDFLHKESRKLINQFDYIFIEDLNMDAMGRALRLGKSVHDIGWGMFINYMTYKALAEGKHVIKIDRFFPSSQLCHVCGIKNKKVKNLKIREWSCPHCGTHHNRDHNAAINIKNEGLRLVLNP